jgi:hypothetical protein
MVASKITFMRRTEGYTILGNKRKDEYVLEELQAEAITTYLRQCRAQWTPCTERMTNTR